MRMCAQTQLSETAHTHKFTAHRHIIEQTHCCTRIVAQVLQILVISRTVRTPTKTSARTDYKKIRGNIGGTHKQSQNIGLLSICGYKKKNRHLSLSRSKIDFWGSMWGIAGRVVAPNYVKNIRQTFTDTKKTFAQA